jgi:hypothetical protein
MRLFEKGDAPIKLRLGDAETYESGVVHLSYLATA